jgi:hypothetical protein
MQIIWPRRDKLARSGIAAAKKGPSDRGTGSPSVAGQEIFSLFIVQGGAGAQPTSCAVGLRGLSHEGEAADG